MKRLLTVLLLLGSYFQVFCQSFTVRNYTTTDGLPSSEVYEVYQDKQGFLWFGTDNGISRFDGLEFRNYHIKDGLIDPVVFGFQEDTEGNVWFRSYSGRLCYMTPEGEIVNYRYSDLLTPLIQGGLLHFIYFADTKDLYFSVRNKVGRIDSLGRITTEMVAAPNEETAILWKTINGKPLIVQTYQAQKIDNVNIDGVQHPIKIPAPRYINKVFRHLTWRGKFYYSFFDYILEYDGAELKLAFHAHYPIISLTTDDKDNLWVGYLNNGVDCFHDPTFKNKSTLDIAKNKSVTCVRSTRDGGLWLTTLENGVYVIPNTAISNFDIPVDRKIKTVHAGKKYVVLADKSGRVKFYDPLTRQIVEEINFEFDVLSVFADRNENYWISGHSTVTIFDKNLKKLKTIENINMVDVCESAATGSIFGLAAQRLYRFDGDLDSFELRVSEDIYRQILVLDSAIYLAGRVGLTVRDRNFENPRPLKAVEANKFSDLLLLNDSSLFLPTNGNGFFIMNIKNESFQHYADENFFALNIHSAMKRGGDLWMGTDEGIAVANIEELLTGNVQFRYLNSRKGLKNKAVNFLVGTANEVWAVSEDAFSIINDSTVHFAEQNPKFYIKGILCNNAAVKLAPSYEFGPSENNLRISFGFINFTHNKMFYRYRINEREPWVYSSEGAAQLTSLAPGFYRFHLQYSVDSYHWADATTLIPFEIQAPWYRRWYTYVIAVILVFVSTYAFVRNRQAEYREKNEFLRIINEHQQKLLQSEVTTIERERNRIAKELHDGVGTNLTAIKMSVRQLLTHHHDPLADDVEEQFQLAIGDLKNIIYDLSPPSLERYGLFVALKNYFNKTEKNLPINIELKTFGNDIDNYNINIIVFRIIQELLSNSIKHSNAKNIVVHLNSFKDVLSIIYEDNGVGFTYDPVQSGLGLDNVESRIRSLNGTLKFDSGKFGVSYNIEIPLNQNSNTTHA